MSLARFIAAFSTSLLTACFAYAAGVAQPLVGVTVPANVVSKTGAVDWERIQELRSKQMKTYAARDRDQRIAADVESYLREVERLKVFPDVQGFRAWFKENQAKVTNNEMTSLMKDASVTEYTTAMYMNYTAQIAVKMDKAAAAKLASTVAPPLAPTAKKLKGPAAAAGAASATPTAGEELIAATTESIWGHPMVPYIGTALSVASGVLIAKAGQLLFFGPAVRITNTATEPFVGPVLERVDREINASVGVHPWMIRWRRFVSGDKARANKAVKDSKSGKELVGHSARFVHPSISVEDFTKLKEDFMREMTTADRIWAGWDNADNNRARNTGFELLFHQYTSFGERQNTYGIAISVAKSDFDRYAKKVEKFGITAAEIEHFEAVSTKYHDLMVFENPRHADVAVVGEELKKIVEDWRRRGVSKKLVDQIYNAQRDTMVATNRKAFSLVNYLYAEMFYRENNLAMKDLPHLQKLQEGNRELSGLYEALEEDAERVGRIFKSMNIKYNVQARIDERGYPLGGPMRPKTVAPVRDPVGEVNLHVMPPCVPEFAKLAP